MRLPEFLDYRDQANVFEEVIGGTYEDILYNGPEGAEQFDGGAVTANMFQFLGVPALAGRVLTPEDAKPGAPQVFVMSYKMWSKRFSRDPDIVGRTFVLNNVPTTLIGIMPPRFTKLNADLYKLASLDRADPEANRRYYNFQARLKPGIGMKQAEAQIDVIARRLSQVYPNEYPKKFTIQLQTLGGQPGRQFPHDPLHLAGSRRAPVAHRVHQRCEHAAGAGLRPRKRNRHSRRARSKPRPAGRPDADREPAAGSRRGGGGVRPRVCGHQVRGRRHPRGRPAPRGRDPAQRSGAAVLARGGGADGGSVRACPRRSGRPPGHRGTAEGGEPRHKRGIPERQVAQHAGGFRGGPLAGAAGRRGPSDAQFRAAAERGSRIRHEEFAGGAAAVSARPVSGRPQKSSGSSARCCRASTAFRALWPRRRSPRCLPTEACGAKSMSRAKHTRTGG